MFFHEITEGLYASVEELEEKYDHFLHLLRVRMFVLSPPTGNQCNNLQTIPDAPLPVAYTQLMKQAGRIRRPYHARAVAVISLCRFLARHYENLTNDQRTATNVEPLEEYVVDLLEELT